MEEMSVLLRRLEELTYHMDQVSALVYVLRDALEENEDKLGLPYTTAAYFLSDITMELKEGLEQVREDLFETFRHWKAEGHGGKALFSESI